MCETLQLNWKLNPSSGSGGGAGGGGGGSTSKSSSSTADGGCAASGSKGSSSSSTGQAPRRKKKEGSSKQKGDGSYTLRAVQKRSEKPSSSSSNPGVGGRKKRGPKPRPKSAPMSKYRRKTANMRERQRMGEINCAFERLRDRIPNPVMMSGRGRCEKLTKINILVSLGRR